MKTRLVVLTFIIVSLTSCAPAPIPTSTSALPKGHWDDVSATSTELGQAEGLALPTKPPAPSALPGAAQTELWKKYQTELAKELLAWYSPKFGFPSGLYKSALCEWDILGRADHLVYVWAYCGVPNSVERDVPAVIYLNDNGYPQKAEAPSPETYWLSDVPGMFPADVQAKFDAYTGNSLFSGRLHEMIAHANYRHTHPDEPPLIIIGDPPTP